MKAVFFDVGGTLIHVDHARLAGVAARVLGRPFTAEAVAASEYGGRAAVEAFMASEAGSSDQSRWTIHFQGMMADLGIGDEEFARLSPELLAEHRREHLWNSIDPGTDAALAALREAGYRVAVISNADGTVDRILDRVGLLNHFEFVVDSGAVGVEKPDPAIFAMALERAGLEAAEVYYVGDVFPIDVVGARAAGLEPVLLDPLGRYGDRGVRTTRSVPALARELVSAREAA